jgi:hypothetical protein
MEKIKILEIKNIEKIKIEEKSGNSLLVIFLDCIFEKNIYFNDCKIRVNKFYKDEIIDLNGYVYKLSNENLITKIKNIKIKEEKIEREDINYIQLKNLKTFDLESIEINYENYEKHEISNLFFKRDLNVKTIKNLVEKQFNCIVSDYDYINMEEKTFYKLRPKEEIEMGYIKKELGIKNDLLQMNYSKLFFEYKMNDNQKEKYKNYFIENRSLNILSAFKDKVGDFLILSLNNELLLHGVVVFDYVLYKYVFFNMNDLINTNKINESSDKLIYDLYLLHNKIEKISNF